ncbi:MAG: IPT/TIG domain-containing protein, partial [Bacteroidetes bacterium]|nr:IPT/TIG domain-containing protein [Bacteroidota bacterium]
MSRPKLSLIIFLYCSTWSAWAQQPIINFVDKTSGNLNEIVIISGNGFSNTPGDLMVFFGSVQGEIVSSTDLIIEARVPSGSIYSPITVTNLASNLTGYSNPQFFMNFGGDGFDPALTDPAVDFTGSNGLFDLCLADFDGDGLNDIATSSINVNTISVYRNTSTISSV